MSLCAPCCTVRRCALQKRLPNANHHHDIRCPADKKGSREPSEHRLPKTVYACLLERTFAQMDAVQERRDVYKRQKQGRIFACESLLNAAAVLLDTDKVVLRMRAEVE